MSEANGTYRIERVGRKTFEIGDKPFTVDVLETFNAWVTIDLNHRESGQHVAEYVKLIARLGGPEDCSHTEAIWFINIIAELSEELKKKVSRTPSLPESSAA